MVKRIAMGILLGIMVFSGFQAFAAETGAIQGKVLLKDGKPLPNVMVSLEGPKLQGVRNSTTNEYGIFRFPLVPVGKFTLTFEMMGMATMKQENVRVTLGSTTPVEAFMDIARFEQTIVVTSAAPLIERDSGDLSTRLTAETLETLPSATRDFRDVAKFVPGVTGVRVDTVDGDTSDGMPSIRGEGQYGNNYLVDGLSVRDPAVKSTGSPLNFDAIEEIQVITDGFSPEYGRALGGTINVITKSGSNEYHGELAMQYESDALAGQEKDALWVQDQDFQKLFPYANLGGPILKDRLWFFVSYNHEDKTTSYDLGDETYKDKNLFGKLTLAISPENTLSVSTTYRLLDNANTDINAGHAADATGKMKRDDLRVRVNFKSILADTTVLEAKYGYINRKADDDPNSGDIGTAQRTENTTSEIYGNYDSFDHNERDRNDVSLELTHFLDDLAGSHELKGGLLYEKTSSLRSLAFTGNDEDLFPDRMVGGSSFNFKNGIPYVYYDYQGATVVNDTDGYGIFLQDKWAPIENLKVMLGFRMDSQDIKNNAGDTLFKFDMLDTFAPRMNLAYDMTKDGLNVVKLGAGRFYDVVSTSLAEWGNTANPYSYDRYEYGGPGSAYSGGTYSPGDEWDPANWGRWRHYDDDGDGTNDRHEFSPGEPKYTQDPEHSPLIYDDNLNAPYKDEFLIEYDRGFTDKYCVKIRYIYSQTRDLIEDVAYNIDEWYITNFDRKRRDYQTVELELAGRPTDSLYFNFAYLWTDSKGTSPGQFEKGGFSSDWGGGNDVGVFGDRPPWDPAGTDYDADAAEYATLLGGLGGLDGDDGWYGPLPYDAKHTVNFNVTYQAPYEIFIGSALQWNSGYFWQKRGFQDAYGGYLTFPEGRGAREMPATTYWDISLAKKFSLGKGLSVSARLDVFNVLDSDKPVSYKQDWDFATEDQNGDGVLDERDDELVNPNFGDVLKRQDPRSMRISFSFAF
jgi:outer membrane receptor for ferrienterochelin and colicin